jgi:aminoglycoside 2'-N-acetyltransferase I
MTASIALVTHGALTLGDLDGLRRLFDREYLHDFGSWDPSQPYGYAHHDLHVIARSDDGVVGHVGWARRTIAVGGAAVAIAGLGGMLISERVRGERLGKRLMVSATQSMLDAGGIDFGYLGCREEVVPFYRSCGWSRVLAGERSIGRDGLLVEEGPGQPILIMPITSELAAWPAGTIDLRGRAW